MEQHWYCRDLLLWNKIIDALFSYKKWKCGLSDCCQQLIYLVMLFNCPGSFIMAEKIGQVYRARENFYICTYMSLTFVSVCRCFNQQ